MQHGPCVNRNKHKVLDQSRESRVSREESHCYTQKTHPEETSPGILFLNEREEKTLESLDAI